MDESQQDTTVPESEMPESADAEQCDAGVVGRAVAEDASGIAATAATAADEATDEGSDDLDAFEVEVEQTLTRTKVVSRLKAIVLELEGGSLEVGGVPVAELGDEVDIEIGYSEKGGKYELEIELEW